MKTITARSLFIGGWIVAALSTTMSAFAADLQPELAQVDNGPVVATPAEAAPTESKPLQGGVTKLEDLLQATESSDLYKVAAKKLAAGVQLTAEEYRSLGAGCFGMESDRTFFQDIAVISIVYKDSPAAKAGLRKGDKLVDMGENDDIAKAHPEIPRWKVTTGQAGTQQNFTVLRHNKPVTLTLTRMNIEDIKEDNIKHEWEQIIAKLGHPEKGAFEGVGKDPLASKAIPSPDSDESD